MEVILAKTAGFCFGVKRAVDTVYQEVGNSDVFSVVPFVFCFRQKSWFWSFTLYRSVHFSLLCLLGLRVFREKDGYDCCATSILYHLISGMQFDLAAFLPALLGMCHPASLWRYVFFDG